MELEILDLGRIKCKKLQLVATDDTAQDIYSPMISVLIRHPKLGNVLYDTGNSPFYRTEYSEEELATYPIDRFRSVEEALAEKGLEPGDIDLLILSHLHFDHAGGLRYFLGTKCAQGVIVADADLREAYARTMSGDGGAYIKQLFDVDGLTYRLIENRLVLADDLELFVQRSHTPGCTGMIVRTQEAGNIIFTSDTVYTREAYEAGIAPGGGINKTESEFFDNLALLKKMQADLNATMFFGHDYDQAREWRERGVIR